jgi:hypothetical protein
MNQMPISECYSPKFNIQSHYHRLIVYIHKVRQLRMVFQTQMPISLVTLVIGIQDLYYIKARTGCMDSSSSTTDMIESTPVSSGLSGEMSCIASTSTYHYSYYQWWLIEIVFLHSWWNRSSYIWCSFNNHRIIGHVSYFFGKFQEY